MCVHQLLSSLQNCVELPAVVASDYSKGLGVLNTHYFSFSIPSCPPLRRRLMERNIPPAALHRTCHRCIPPVYHPHLLPVIPSLLPAEWHSITCMRTHTCAHAHTHTRACTHTHMHAHSELKQWSVRSFSNQL